MAVPAVTVENEVIKASYVIIDYILAVYVIIVYMNLIEYCIAMRTTYHHGNLRAELLTLGEQAVAASGVDHLGLREVARQAGVTIGAVFRHFSSKDDLVRAIALEGFRSLLESLEGAERPDSRATLREGFRAYLAFAAQRPGCIKCMFGGVLERSLPESDAVQWSTKTFDWLVAAVNRGQSDGWLRPARAEQTALALFSALHGASHLLLELKTLPAFGRLAPEDLADLLFDSHGVAPASST